jgi:hypothetical protein
MSRAPKEAPTPMPTLASVDNEDGRLEEEGLGEKEVAAEGIFGPAS